MMTTLTKYYEQKSKYPDAIILFRVGDFYEAYERDAVDAAELLGIVLSARKTDFNSKICFVGFPYMALDTYLPMIIRADRRVVISE